MSARVSGIENSSYLTSSGLNMHLARHTFATELRRAAGIDAVSQALGHSDISTTCGYLRPSRHERSGACDGCLLARQARRFRDLARNRSSRINTTNGSISPKGGGGGNRTRVRGRTGQSVYECSLRFSSHPGSRFAGNLLPGQPSCDLTPPAIGAPSGPARSLTPLPGPRAELGATRHLIT